jgi:beta-galactosidase
MGCNAIRTSHNPPSPELLDLCDQMGFLVMDEAFDEWKENKEPKGYGKFFDQWSEPDLASMVDRDRNHPSVILWSIGNEILEGREMKPEAATIAQRLVGICHREDPSRPVTAGCVNPTNVWKSGLAKALDVFGINYYVYWYGKNDPAHPADGTGKDCDYAAQLPMIASETASMVQTRGEYGMKLDASGNVQFVPKPNFQVSSYNYLLPNSATPSETDLLALKNAPWVAGEFDWTGFDYIGEPCPYYSWPCRSSYFGMLDLCGFPKDRYYIYKSQWSSEPFAHILPSSWTWEGFDGKTIPVWVFTNADSVELFLNGTSLGEKRYPADCSDHTLVAQNKDTTVGVVKARTLHLAWDVPYSPGVLKAVAKKDGRVVATDELHTAGAPASISLTPDRTDLQANGQDLAFIKLTLLDKDGNVCPNADNEIEFSVTGTAADLAGVDDGDATNHESFQGTKHKAFHGLALAVLKTHYDTLGAVTLTASAAGLPPATTTLNVAAP